MKPLCEHCGTDWRVNSDRMLCQDCSEAIPSETGTACPRCGASVDHAASLCYRQHGPDDFRESVLCWRCGGPYEIRTLFGLISTAVLPYGDEIDRSEPEE